MVSNQWDSWEISNLERERRLVRVSFLGYSPHAQLSMTKNADGKLVVSRSTTATFWGKVVFFVKCVIHTQHYCVVTRIFRSKTRTTKRGKERETIGCFQSQVTNCVSTKTRTKTKYQTSCGQNSYQSSFSFSEQKLPCKSEITTDARAVSFVIFLR